MLYMRSLVTLIADPHLGSMTNIAALGCTRKFSCLNRVGTLLLLVQNRFSTT